MASLQQTDLSLDQVKAILSKLLKDSEESPEAARKRTAAINHYHAIQNQLEGNS